MSQECAPPSIGHCKQDRLPQKPIKLQVKPRKNKEPTRIRASALVFSESGEPVVKVTQDPSCACPVHAHVKCPIAEELKVEKPSCASSMCEQLSNKSQNVDNLLLREVVAERTAQLVDDFQLHPRSMITFLSE